MSNFYTFEKYQERWYIDLPSWEGPKDDLEMVMGADTLLDIISQDKNSVRIHILEEPMEGWNYRLDYLRDDSGGAYYMINHNTNLITPFECWLCKVTSFVFGYLPKTIYFK